MPKSSSFTCPVAGHQHVGGLDVAMQDTLLVRVLHRLHHLQEQLDPLARRQPALVGPLQQVAPRHVLQSEVGPAVAGDAGIVEVRDVRMLERGQDVALDRETLRQVLAPGQLRRRLQRDVALEGPVGALCQPHFGHAAGAKAARQLVRADALTLLQVADCAQPLDVELRQRRQRIAGAGRQRAPQRRREVGMLGRQRLQPLCALRLVGVDHFVEQPAQARQLQGRQLHRRPLNPAPASRAATGAPCSSRAARCAR
jgi:hypothetical protein